MKTTYLILLLAIGTIISCSKSDDQTTTPATTYTQATFSDATITRVIDEQWRPYDQIGIFVIDEQGDQLEQSNMRYKTASLGTTATFVAADESIYYDKEGTQIGFIAYSPYSSSLSGESYAIDISENQSTPDLIDLLRAQTAAKYSEENPDVQLTFGHILAKVTLTLQAGEGFASENLQGATITISGVAPTGTYNIISDELSVGAQSDSQITCRTISSGEEYQAILIPDSGIELSAQIIIGSSSYPWSLSDLTLERGEEYSYTLTVDEQGITVSSPTINSWEVGQDDDNSLYSTKFFDISFDGDYYNICTAAGLHAFANLVNGQQDDLGIVRDGQEFAATFGDKNPSLNARLMNNIDLQGSEDNQWSPIGTADDPYCGTFDGGNNVVSGLYINSSGLNDMGFIGVVGYGGAVRQLTVEGSITSDADANGGIAGTANSGSVVEYCTSRATIVGGGYTGGVVGENYTEINYCNNQGDVTGTTNVGGISGYPYSSISYCYNSGDVTGDSCIGGIIGGSYATSSFDVIDCHNSGTITADNYQVGGIAGDTYGGISYCSNSGEVSGLSDVGGICGKLRANLSYCSNSGKITGRNSGTGGIVGSLYGRISVNSSYNTGEVVGVYSVGGIVGTSSYSTYNCYNRGNVSGYNCVGGITGYWYYTFYGDHILANSYNTGVINGFVSTGGILGLSDNETRLDIYCAYYFDTIETTQTYGESMSEDYMKTSAFVDLINDGQTVWVIDDADNPINDGFPILDWQLTQR